MAKKQKRAQQELESLIPTIKSAEKQLADQLAVARTEAERLVLEAEKEAEVRVERAKADLPALLSAQREKRMEALRREAEDALRAALEESGDREGSAEQKMNDAVAYIVSRVWPAADPRETEAT
jgi:F0F1-type ATP synthase membrane subunit b/b'